MTAYYNEFDPKAAAWLRELIKQGHIADGVVDDRSIEDVTPTELAGFTQCHFFAGIGVWSYALRRAGWADDRPVWTGSCPCQPFSAAGKGAGFADERHLWPAFHHLISQCQPAIVFGEQVASKDGLGWLDLVCADLEATGYASGAVDLCAAGVGAPHIRQRLWWVGTRLADPNNAGSQGRLLGRADQGWQDQLGHGGRGGAVGGLADTSGIGWERGQGSEDGREHDGPDAGWQQGDDGAVSSDEAGAVGLANSERAGIRDCGCGLDTAETRGEQSEERQRERIWSISGADGSDGSSTRPSPTNGFWRDADWLFCRDGKWRPVEPGTSPLAHGASDSLANVLSICKVASDRVEEYANRSQANPSEILRMVREHLYKETGWEEQPTGMRGKLYAPEVLLTFMLSQTAACDRATDSSSVKKAGKETVAGAMHIMRMDGGFVHSSHQRRPNGQQRVQSANPLHELSFLLACDAQAFGKAVFDAHAALNRVGMLRGYGNAIVAQAAQAFIESVMD
jgi:DNA (cytosine-5)-methyltransferase 1